MYLGIVIGVQNYVSSKYDNLAACQKDAEAMKNVLSNVKDFKDILYLNKDEKGGDLKRRISEFVETYQGQEVEELVFYFSGHGERFKEDFFYLPSDFDSSKRETTGLRNSDLDNWMKTLAPRLCVKIVDACFSGTQYIKSESSTNLNLRKSAKDYGLKDLYFLFSSRDNQSSYAGDEFSIFTESILSALLNKNGRVRYGELIEAVADDLGGDTESCPTFVIQASNTEKFGDVTEDTHRIIYDAFGLTPEASDHKSTEDTKPQPSPVHQSVFEAVQEKSQEICFRESSTLSFIENFNSQMSRWDSEIFKIYELSIEHSISSYQVPNSEKIGVWLKNNKDKNYFAEPTIDVREVKSEEYKEVPRKPNNNPNFLSRNRIFGLGVGLYDEPEYKLETVTKEVSYIDGFQYTHKAQNRILKIALTPTIELVDPVSIFIVPIYSNKEYVINFSFEFLRRNDWNSYSSPECSDWNNFKVDINSDHQATNSANHVKNEIENWLTTSVEKLLD